LSTGGKKGILPGKDRPDLAEREKGKRLIQLSDTPVHEVDCEKKTLLVKVGKRERQNRGALGVREEKGGHLDQGGKIKGEKKKNFFVLGETPEWS